MDLGNEHIPKLVRQIAIPASVGMFFNTMYNVVDTFWAGQLSPEALAALSLSLIPFIGLLAVGFGLGQGAVHSSLMHWGQRTTIKPVV